MTWSITPTRAVLRAALPTLGIAVLAFPCSVQAFTPSVKGGSENQPLSTSPTTSASHAATTGPSLVRTIVGLVIVIAVIWGLTWILRQVKSGRARGGAGAGLTSMASLPLGSGRTLHLVRAGRDYLLLGSAEHGVVPIYRYTEQQALETGLLDNFEEPAEEYRGAGDPAVGASDPIAGAMPMEGTPGRTRVRPAQMPGQTRPARGTPGARGPGGDFNLVERLREWTVRR
jgi:flagellar protein FliO/FliZ